MSTLRPREDARRQHERPHVLIVTDDPSLTDFLGEGLVMGGFWTSVISHGLQVLEVFRHRRFDLIVIDRDLGTFDAVELMERLRGLSAHGEREPRTRVPMVVMASGEPDLGEEQQERLGIASILQAPVELKEVVQALHGIFAVWRVAHPDTPLADEA
ncbi:MAG: response regulator [Chloroflexota bacterium]|nr:response regulator [Chloroflexota bacterium]